MTHSSRRSRPRAAHLAGAAPRPWPLFTAAILATATTAARADTVRLHRDATLPAGATTVRLADVADLDGPEAVALGDLVLVELDPGQATTDLALRRVRAALDTAGVNWGRVNLSGSRVHVSARPRGGPAPGAMAPVSLAPAEAPEPAGPSTVGAKTLIGEATVAGAIARLAVEMLRVDPADLRLVLDPDDRPLLEAPLGHDRYELHPQGNLAGERVRIAVRRWSGEDASGESHLTVHPLVRTAVAVLTRDVRRDDEIRPADLEVVERWLAPVHAALLCPPVAAAGRVAARALRTGTDLRRRDVERAVLVRRGEPVVVRCIVGGVAITMGAVAHGDGRLDDLVEVRKRGERDVILARVIGRGEALVDLASPRPSAASRRADGAPTSRGDQP